MANEAQSSILDMTEFKSWSFYRAIIMEFVATLLYLYVTVATIIGQKKQAAPDGMDILIIAWAFGGMTFLIVNCISGTSGGFGNPAVIFALFSVRKASLNRAVVLSVAQCLGAICGVGLVKETMKPYYNSLGGGVNFVGVGYSMGGALLAEIIGTFVVVYTVISTVDAKKAFAPFSTAFAVFTVHLAIIPITGAGINPARSFGAAVIFNQRQVWNDQWLFWFGPFLGTVAATLYHVYIVKSGTVKAIKQFYNEQRRTLPPRDLLQRHQQPPFCTRLEPLPSNPRSNPQPPLRTHGAIPSTTRQLQEQPRSNPTRQ